MKPTLSPSDWRAIAVECADALADLTLQAKRPVTDAEANTLLERAATRLCEAMLKHRVPHHTIEPVLNAMAEAYERRLNVLEAAMAQGLDNAKSN